MFLVLLSCYIILLAAGTHLILRLPSTTEQPILRSLSSQADVLIMSLDWRMKNYTFSTGWRISDQCYLWSTMSTLLWWMESHADCKKIM